MPNDDLSEDIESLIDVKPLIIDNKTVHTVTMEYQGVSVIKLYGFYYPNFLVKNIRVNGNYLIDHLILLYDNFLVKFGKLKPGTKMQFTAKIMDHRAEIEQYKKSGLYEDNAFHNPYTFEDISDFKLLDAEPGEILPNDLEEEAALTGYAMLMNPENYDPWYVVQYRDWLIKNNLSTKEVLDKFLDLDHNND